MVVQGAIALAECRQSTGYTIDLDMVIIAAVLHDVSKLVEFGPGQEPGTAVKTDHGRKFQHGFYGAHWAMAVGLPDDIAHIILSHSGSTRTFPLTEEGLLVLYADLADADICRLRAGAPLLVQRSRETGG
jgi:putative nucleotidyltransferase with HDIG domain